MDATVITVSGSILMAIDLNTPHPGRLVLLQAFFMLPVCLWSGYFFQIALSSFQRMQLGQLAATLPRTVSSQDGRAKDLEQGAGDAAGGGGDHSQRQ